MNRRFVMAAVVCAAGCDAAPAEVAIQYVVAREHGHPRQAYALLSQDDRDVRAFRDFAKRRVRSIDDRVDRLLARRTKVRGRLIESDAKSAKVDIETVQVDIEGNARRLIADDLAENGPGIASRLQRMELPVVTANETISLVREAGDWRVFLDLSQGDRAAAARRLDDLKRRAGQRARHGQLEWARELYQRAAEIAPKDRQVQHALHGLQTVTEAALEYRAKVTVNSVRVEGQVVSAELQNHGRRDLDEVELLVVALDDAGAPVIEVPVVPVRYPKSDERLAAGRSLKWKATIPGSFSRWTGKVDIRVVRVRLAP